MQWFCIHNLFLQRSWFAVLLFALGCTREYSYEAEQAGSPLLDSVPVVATDTLALLSSCSLCTGVVPPGSWSLQIDNDIFCRKIDTAIVNKDRTAFTFFGPSRCSADSGLIISVYLDEPGLVRSRQQLSTGKVAFYYYDNVVGGYAQLSKTGKPFQLTISNYDHQTKTAVGNFSGYIYGRDGRESEVKGGSFQTVLK